MSPQAWETFLSSELGTPVVVKTTRSRRLPIQVRTLRSPDRLEVRMNAFFADAPEDLRSAVASWIRSGSRAPRACRALDAFLDASLKRVPAPASSLPALRAAGDAHDLEALRRVVLQHELAGEFAPAPPLPAITWAARGSIPPRRGLRLGSYDPDRNLVRIHPVLDQRGVPEWFVRFIVFHELLHALHPPRRGPGGRWIHHGREFRERERAHPEYARVLAFERAHLTALVRSARRGTEFTTAEPSRRRRVVELVQRLLFAV